MNALARIGDFMRALSGWRRVGFGFAAGAVSALGFAPLNLFPVLLLGFAALLLLLDGANVSPHRLRAAFFSGWSFGFGQFLVGLHWIGYAFLVDSGAHLWQMPFALVFLTAGLALYSGMACVAAMYLWRRGVARILIFAIFYAATEWLRGHLFTGFPWNLQAYGWGASLAVMQSAGLFGAYGLSCLTILLGASLADFPRRAPMLMLALFAGFWGYGAWRLNANPVQAVPGVSVRLVQPDIPQREKYLRPLVARNWQRLIDLTHAPGPSSQKKPTHIIWPEAAPSFILMRSPLALDQIALLTNGATLITGAERVGAEGGALAFFNSLYVFGQGGRLDGTYDKFHLVPFGEYVPFANLLARAGITKLTNGPSGFTAGDGPHVYAASGAPAMTPLICYEIIFPAAVTDHQSRPQWFVNVTDDSWFGPWAGPHQHLLIARMRAIEEAVPVARAANTGVSAMIDATGRITASLGFDQMGVVDAPLPRALAPTPYARFGDWIFALMLMLLAGAAFLRRTAQSLG